MEELGKTQGWITKVRKKLLYEGVPSIYEMSFKICYRLARSMWSMKKATDEEKAWWIFRWIFFNPKTDPIDTKDIQARIVFLRKFIARPTFHGFLSLKQAYKLAQTYPHHLILSMDDTRPGKVNGHIFNGREIVVFFIYVDKNIPHRPTLKKLVKYQQKT